MQSVFASKEYQIYFNLKKQKAAPKNEAALRILIPKKLRQIYHLVMIFRKFIFLDCTKESINVS